ncbi:unnamed protein product [Rhizoctonia solani]|uniref:Transmembrane protein n=1 Tax=Rhizoctonia solani TaxID=456999 RepID=A0A8H3GXK3_9AGAM|nr:unnamed protein product [Rhizoctonia solani]
MIIKDQSSAGWNYYEASTDDGASSSRMSHLQHEPDHANDAQRPPSPHQIHTIHSPPSDSPARRRLGLTAFASTLFVVAMSAGLATFFLLFIILSQVSNVSDPAAFVVRERVFSSNQLESSSLSALAVSTAISHFLSITTPVVLSLLAYRTAYLWIQAKASPSADEEGDASCLPTPLHYGLLVRILNSSTILNLGPLAAYFLPRLRRRQGPENTTPISPPRLLREAFATAFFVYVLSHTIGLADIWLHSVASVGIADMITPAQEPPKFSMVFNQTLCDPSTGLDCMKYSDHWGNTNVVRTGELVAANSTNSANTSVISLADENYTAILTPSDFIREWNFTASTYGARSQCYPISNYCAETGCDSPFVTGPAIDAGMSLENLRFPKSSSKISSRGPGFGDYRDMPRVMAYVGNVTVGSPTGVPSSVASAIPPNPGPVLIKLRWTDTQSASFSFDRSRTNTMLEVDMIPSKASDEEFQSRFVTTLYAQCQLEFVKVRYGYNQQQQFVAQHVKRMDEGDASVAAVLWSPLIWQQFTDQFVNNIRQACLTDYSEEGTTAILGQELSRLAIGSAAGLFMRTNQSVSDASTITQVLVGRYPRTPVYVFAGLLYAYAALAIILFLSTAACTSDVIAFRSDSDHLNKEGIDGAGTKSPKTYTALQLAQRRLVDPATLIAEQYVWAPHSSPSQASAMATQLRTADMFGVNQPNKTSAVPERLFVGLGGPYADNGDPRFGVWRRPKRQIDTESDRLTYMPGAPSSIGMTNPEMMEGTTLAGSTLHSEQNGLPPAYATLSRGTRSRSDGSEYILEYAARHTHGSGLVDTRTRVEGRHVDLNVGPERRPLPEKDWSALARVPSNASSQGSEASTSTIRTVRRSTGV